MLAGFGELGLDVGELCARAGIDPSAVADPDGSVPIPRVVRLMHGAQRAWGGPDVASRAAAAIPFGTFEVLDYLMQTAPDAGGALVRLTRYFRLGTAMFHHEVVRMASSGEHHVRTRHAIADALTPPLLRDYMQSAMVNRVVRFSGVRPVRVELRDGGHAGDAAYAETLGTELRTHCAFNALVYDEPGWRHPIEGADAVLSAVLERHAADLLSRQPPGTLQGAVRQGQMDVLQTGEVPSAAQIGRSLAMSERTLQRRLADLGTSFSELLDDTRRELARGYLSESTLSIGEVALLLGYSEQSAFNRAFKRWTGTTPSAYRRASPS